MGMCVENKTLYSHKNTYFNKTLQKKNRFIDHNFVGKILLSRISLFSQNQRKGRLTGFYKIGKMEEGGFIGSNLEKKIITLKLKLRFNKKKHIPLYLFHSHKLRLKQDFD